MYLVVRKKRRKEHNTSYREEKKIVGREEIKWGRGEIYHHPVWEFIAFIPVIYIQPLCSHKVSNCLDVRIRLLLFHVSRKRLSKCRPIKEVWLSLSLGWGWHWQVITHLTCRTRTNYYYHCTSTTTTTILLPLYYFHDHHHSRNNNQYCITSTSTTPTTFTTTNTTTTTTTTVLTLPPQPLLPQALTSPLLLPMY